MLSTDLAKTAQVWSQISEVLLVPRNEIEYERAVTLLDELIDEVGEDEDHPLASLMETLGALIETYENNHFPEPMGDPISSLQEFMTEYGLSAADLPELGEVAEVTRILQGRQELTLPQIRALAQRFGVSPAVFV